MALEMNTSLTLSPGAELLSGGMRKMVGLIRQIGHENGGEIDVRRLQRMLEETLTKNMHLQVTSHSIQCQGQNHSLFAGGR